MLEDARNIGLMAGHFELQLECQIYLSDPPRQSGDHATALDILERSLNFARYSNLPHDPNWIVPGDRVVTRNLEYLGQAHAALGHYDEFLRCYSEALIVHDGSTKDVTHEAFLVSAMASFARDGEVSNDLPDSLLKRAYALPETPYIIAHRFATYRSIAINKAVNGDYFGALQCLREAKKLALDLPYNVVCAADHAFVAFLFGHDHAGEEQLNSGIDTALQTNWEESRHESHYGLVILAHVAAARSTRSARKLIEIFRGVRRDIPLMSGSNWDRRIRMIFLMSEGCVMKAEGRIAEAKELLSEVFAFYQASGAFRRLAADAALELAELTNDPRLFGYAAKWINAHPLPYTVKRLAALRELLPR
jgi:tetratricopeptide (TPR) repeat protein